MDTYPYIIVGAGLAGVSAIAGIRELDPTGEILLIGEERYLPYHRPPLSKKLWFGTHRVEDICIRGDSYFEQQGVKKILNCKIAGIDSGQRQIIDQRGRRYLYKKLLIATGGVPRELDVPGGGMEEINYFRTLDSYLRLHEKISNGTSAVVVGGGFIGAEIAAALNSNRVDVTMIFPDNHILARIFPESFGRIISGMYEDRGVKIINQDVPIQFEKSGNKIITITKNGKKFESDVLVAGVGIEPSVDLAVDAGLKVHNGIEVNAHLETSCQDIFAAGDVAWFPYRVLNKNMRIEHWDHAKKQGKQAGRNMAGAGETYDYMPYFYSDLFGLGLEAIGEVDASLETISDWNEDSEKGVFYYLKEGRIRGVLWCNVWHQLEDAREWIRKGERMTLPFTQQKQFLA